MQVEQLLAASLCAMSSFAAAGRFAPHRDEIAANGRDVRRSLGVAGRVRMSQLLGLDWQESPE
jgi:hypothetical protein